MGVDSASRAALSLSPPGEKGSCPGRRRESGLMARWSKILSVRGAGGVRRHAVPPVEGKFFPSGKLKLMKLPRRSFSSPGNYLNEKAFERDEGRLLAIPNFLNLGARNAPSPGPRPGVQGYLSAILNILNLFPSPRDRKLQGTHRQLPQLPRGWAVPSRSRTIRFARSQSTWRSTSIGPSAKGIRIGAVRTPTVRERALSTVSRVNSRLL